MILTKMKTSRFAAMAIFVAFLSRVGRRTGYNGRFGSMLIFARYARKALKKVSLHFVSSVIRSILLNIRNGFFNNNLTDRFSSFRHGKTRFHLFTHLNSIEERFSSQKKKDKTSLLDAIVVHPVVERDRCVFSVYRCIVRNHRRPTFRYVFSENSVRKTKRI